MKSPLLLSAFLFALALGSAQAQTDEPPTPAPAPAQAAAPAREVPPDSKAFQDANKITDPAKKIEALEKFKKDFPNSSMLHSADMNIVSTLASKMPEQKARIEKVAAGALKTAKDKKEKGSLSGQIADSLLSANVLLKDAEKYAKASLAVMNQAEFVADQKAQFAKRAAGRGGRGGNQQPPTDAELIKRYQQSRATRLTLLGRIEFALGKTSAAQKLLEESYSLNSNQPAAAAALGEIAARKGDQTKALDYLVTARLAGNAAPATVETLTSVYSKTHNGSTAGLEDMLDAEYARRFPNPLHLDAYRPAEKRTDRLVLAEVFTGSGCPPCVGADLAFEAAMEHYSRKDLAVVMYHQHVPRPDPMTNSDTQARNKYYGVTGVPTYAVDGATVKYNGAGREETKGVWEHIQPPIEKELEAASEAKISVNASASGNSVKVAASVDAVKSESKDLKIHILLLEKELHYSGENGIRIHPMVVRAMGGKDDDGFALEPGAPGSAEQSWDLDKLSAELKTQLDDYEAKGHRGNPFKFIEKKYQIDRANLAVMVFVQDAKTKHILQSAYVDLNPAAPHIPTSNASGSK